MKTFILFEQDPLNENNSTQSKNNTPNPEKLEKYCTDQIVEPQFKININENTSFNDYFTESPTVRIKTTTETIETSTIRNRDMSNNTNYSYLKNFLKWLYDNKLTLVLVLVIIVLLVVCFVILKIASKKLYECKLINV